MKFFTKRKNDNIKKKLRNKNKITRKNIKKMVGGGDPIKNNNELFTDLFSDDKYTQRYKSFDELNYIDKQELFKSFPTKNPIYYKFFEIGLPIKNIRGFNIGEDGIKSELERLYQDEKKYLTDFESNKCENVNLIYHNFHGKYSKNEPTFFKVPENTYICFITEIGHLGYIPVYDEYYNGDNLLMTFENLKIEQMKKICSHRGNFMRLEENNITELCSTRILSDDYSNQTLINCFMNSSWYYPGQACPDAIVTFNMVNRIDFFPDTEMLAKCKRFFINGGRLSSDYYDKYSDIWDRILNPKKLNTVLSKYVYDLNLNFKNDKKYNILILDHCRKIKSGISHENLNKYLEYESLNSYMISNLNTIEDIQLNDINILNNVLCGSDKDQGIIAYYSIKELNIINKNYNIPNYVDKINKILNKLKILYGEKNLPVIPSKLLKGCLSYVGNYDLNVYFYFFKNLIESKIEYSKVNELIHFFFDINYEKIDSFFTILLITRIDEIIKYKDKINDFLKSVCRLYSLYLDFLNNLPKDKVIQPGTKKEKIIKFIKNDLKLLSEGPKSICPLVSTENELVIGNETDLRENDVFNIKVLRIHDIDDNFRDIYFRVEEIIFEEVLTGPYTESHPIKINYDLFYFYLKRINLSKIKKITIKNCFIENTLFLQLIDNNDIYVEINKTNIKDIIIYNVKKFGVLNQVIDSIDIRTQLDYLYINGNLNYIYYNYHSFPAINKLVIQNSNINISTNKLSIKNLTLIDIIGGNMDYSTNPIFLSLLSSNDGEIDIDSISIEGEMDKFIEFLIKKELNKILIKSINQKINSKKIYALFKNNRKGLYLKENVNISSDTIKIVSEKYRINRKLEF